MEFLLILRLLASTLRSCLASRNPGGLYGRGELLQLVLFRASPSHRIPYFSCLWVTSMRPPPSQTSPAVRHVLGATLPALWSDKSGGFSPVVPCAASPGCSQLVHPYNSGMKSSARAGKKKTCSPKLCFCRSAFLALAFFFPFLAFLAFLAFLDCIKCVGPTSYRCVGQRSSPRRNRARRLPARGQIGVSELPSSSVRVQSSTLVGYVLLMKSSLSAQR